MPGAHEESEMISAHMVSAAHMCTGLSILGSALSTVSLVSPPLSLPSLRMRNMMSEVRNVMSEGCACK